MLHSRVTDPVHCFSSHYFGFFYKLQSIKRPPIELPVTKVPSRKEWGIKPLFSGHLLAVPEELVHCFHLY